MTLPPNIRVNASAPFPSLIKATGPLTLTKANGIWTVGFSFATLGIEIPSAQNFPSDYVLVYDSIAGGFFQMSLATLSSTLLSGGRLQRSITAADNLPIAANDSILNFNATTDLTPTVPPAASRNGAPLTFKNLPGSHMQTLSPTAASGDSFDGEATIELTPGMDLTLRPYDDGVNDGYAIA